MTFVGLLATSGLRYHLPDPQVTPQNPLDHAIRAKEWTYGEYPIGRRPMPTNPAPRQDESLRTPPLPIQEIKAKVEICGGPPRKPPLARRPVAVVKWVDGTLLDTVWQIAE